MMREYDKILYGPSGLVNQPLVINQSLAEGDGEHETLGQEAIRRTVMRVEWRGYQYRKRRLQYRKYRIHRSKPAPVIAEVLSCGHEIVGALGCYPWKRPRKTTGCGECWRDFFVSTPSCSEKSADG